MISTGQVLNRSPRLCLKSPDRTGWNHLKMQAGLDWSFSLDLMHFQSWFFHLSTLTTVICFSLPSSHILLSSTISPLRTLFLAETQSVHVPWESLHSASWYLPCFWHQLRLVSEEVSCCLQMDSRVGFLSSVLTATPLSKPPRCWYLVSLALLHGCCPTSAPSLAGHLPHSKRLW